MQQPPPLQPDCFRCRFFYTTWKPNLPRGCRAYAIESKQVPSIEIKLAD